MADMRKLARLHRFGEQITKISSFPQPVKTDKLSDSQPVAAPPLAGRTIYRGFRIAREEMEAYTFDANLLMSIMPPGAPPDQATRFSELRERERLQQLIERLAARRIGVR